MKKLNITVPPIKLPSLSFTMPSWKAILTSKYLWTLVIAIVWLTFFDSFSFLRQRNMAQQIDELKRSKGYYSKEIHRLDYRRDLIFADDQELERFAREKYYMHRPDEDVYLITTKPEPVPHEQPVVESEGIFRKKTKPERRTPFEQTDTLKRTAAPAKGELSGE